MQDCIEYFSALLPVKAVTLVAHGLNMKPAAMLPIIAWLNQMGSDACLLKLSGHHQHSVNIQTVTDSLWHEEVHSSYAIAKAAADKQGVPLFFIGFSLGALLVQVLLAAAPENVFFDKQVLLAPATALRQRCYALKPIISVNKKIMLPSYAPAHHRANNFLPVAAYKILFRNEKHIRCTCFNNLNIPTVIFIDPKDELISYKKLVKYSQQYKLTNYTIVPLASRRETAQSHYHHLIVSEETMGSQNWEMATAQMSLFLFNE